MIAYYGAKFSYTFDWPSSQLKASSITLFIQYISLFITNSRYVYKNNKTIRKSSTPYLSLSSTSPFGFIAILLFAAGTWWNFAVFTFKKKVSGSQKLLFSLPESRIGFLSSWTNLGSFQACLKNISRLNSLDITQIEMFSFIRYFRQGKNLR